MKNAIIILSIALLFASCKNHHKMNNANFRSERVSKTASITINGKIEDVFPLFGAFEERKWAEGWNPTLVYPAKEIIEEGTTFKTPGHGHDESEFLWIVTRYEPGTFLIQYLVSCENRFWTITIKCNSSGENKTSAEITYSFAGLNELGNEINSRSLRHMYAHDLKDWEEAINFYLTTGKALPHK